MTDSSQFTGGPARLAALLTAPRLRLWGAGLLFLTVALYVQAMATTGLVDRAGRFKGSDYVQFYVMGSMVLEGRTGSLYDAGAHLETARRLIHPELGLYAAHPNYGPQVAVAFAPLAVLPFGWSLTLFLVLMVSCYGAAVWMVWRECPQLREHGPLVALLAAASPSAWAMIRYGQLSGLTLLLFALALVALRGRRWFAAGVVLGCLAYKPQLGFLIGFALVAGRCWRVAAGAAVAFAVQFGIGWAVAAPDGMTRYVQTLWMLLLNPSLVQLHPTEVHSWRGLLQLLISSPALVTAGFLIALALALFSAARCWRSPAPAGLRWAQLIVLTVLAAPHLLAYDLIILTVPLLVLANWSLYRVEHPGRAAVSLLLVPVYLAPFSGNLSRLIDIQLSVVALSVLAWRLHALLTERPSGSSAEGDSDAAAVSVRPADRRAHLPARVARG